MNFPAEIFEVSRGPTSITPPGRYDIMTLLALLYDLFFEYQLLKIVPPWLAEMLNSFTMFWIDLQIGSSEKPYKYSENICN